jgi:hypothetical protein
MIPNFTAGTLHADPDGEPGARYGELLDISDPSVAA